MKYSHQKINKRNITFQTGMGYVIIARDVDREEFVTMCYRTNTVFLLSSTGKSYEKVKVTRGLLNYIEFPEEDLNLGSSVVWAIDQSTGYPMIIGVLAHSSIVGDLGEHQFSLGRDFENASVSISGDAVNGILLIDASYAGAGQLNLTSDDLLRLEAKTKASIESETVDLVVKSSYNMKIKAAGDDSETNAGYVLGTGYNYKDEFGNEIEVNKDHVKIKTKKFVQEVENYSMKELMEDLVDAMAKITIATSLGNQAPLNMSQIIALNNKIEQIFE